MKYIIVALLLNMSIFSLFGYSQIFTDGFNPYTTGDLGTQGGWAPLGPGAQIQVESSSPMNYNGYPGSDLQNYITVPQSSVAWSYKNFSSQYLSSDFNLWVSFLIRINYNVSNGSYIMTFRDFDNKTDGAMLYVTQGSSSSYVNFGVCKLSQIAYSGDYSVGSVHLIVMKYSYHLSARDTMFLWVDPVLNNGEPPVSSAVAFDAANNDPNWKTSVSYIDLRPLNNNVGFSLDGFRLGNTWQQAPLPVSLESFNYSVSGSSVKLRWVTSSETNNKGFEIIRNGCTAGWIDGKGSTNIPQNYIFEDKYLPPGDYNYSLKQIDYNGVSTTAGNINGVKVNPPHKFRADVFPNPFNPSTKIKFDLPDDCHLKVNVYDASGRLVKTVADEFRLKGAYEILFDGSRLSSGVYICSINAGDKSMIKKIVLAK